MLPLSARLVPALGLLLAASACHWNRPRPVYELRQGILYPPGDAPSGARSQRAVRIGLRLEGAPACRTLAASFRGRGMGLKWKLDRGRMQIEVDPVVSRFSYGTPVALLRGVQELRAALASLAAQSCLAPARVRATLARLSESAPLSPALAQAVLLGPYPVQMYIDVTDPVELQLTYALHRDQPSRYDLGYVAQVYRVVPTSSDGRGRLLLAATAIKSAPAGTQPVPPPPLALAASACPSFFRLFFYLRRSPSDHDVALVSATDRAALGAATRALLSKPNQCQLLAVAGARCIVMPPDVGLESRLRVLVQGRWTTLPITATVRQALAAAGLRHPARALPTLRVLLPFRSGYAPVVAAGRGGSLLSLLLRGKEQISW